MKRYTKYYSSKKSSGLSRIRNRIDPTSERYRKCPNCHKEFITNHLSRIYCTDYCADDYHNRKKRLLKKRREEQNIYNLKHDQIISDANLAKNIKILDELEIDTQNGSIYHIEQLEAIGLNLSYYSGRAKLQNINDELGSHFVQIGLYRIFRIEYSTLLIKKQNLSS